MSSERRPVRCPFALLLYFLLTLLSTLLSTTVAAVACAVNLSFVPSKAKLLDEGEPLRVDLFWDCSANESDAAARVPVCYSHPTFAISSATPKIILVDYDAPKPFAVQSASGRNLTFIVTGKFLGYGHVDVQVICRDKSGTQVTHTIPYFVPVSRRESTLNYVFIGVLSLLLCVANFLMASEIHLNVVWAVIKRPIAPAIGFFSQFVLMPLISFAVAQIAFVPHGLSALGLGVFVAGCSPGGGASNAYTYLLDGNIDLSVTMTFLSTVLSYGMMPLWMHLLAGKILVDANAGTIQMPYRNIGISLLLLIVPLNLGVVLWRFKRNWAVKAKKILRPFFFFVIVFICTLGVYSNLYMFEVMTVRSLVAGMCVPWLGFLFGALMAIICRQSRANVVAISLETGIQNTGIAIVMLQLSFPKPDSDIASVMPVIVALFTPVPVLLVMAIHYGRRWWPKLKECRFVKKDIRNQEMMNSFSSGEDAIGLSVKDHKGRCSKSASAAAPDRSGSPSFICVNVPSRIIDAYSGGD